MKKNFLTIYYSPQLNDIIEQPQEGCIPINYYCEFDSDGSHRESHWNFKENSRRFYKYMDDINDAINRHSRDLIERAFEEFYDYEVINENKTNKNMKKNVQRINESQLRAIIAESVKKVLRENDDKPFMDTGLGADSKHFKRYDTNDGPLVLYNGKVYKWSFVEFMRHKDEMIEKHGILSNKAVGEWMSNGGLPQSNVNVNDLQGMQDEWQRDRDAEKHKALIIKAHRPEFENACDDLYYGYGYNTWLKQQRSGGSSLSDEEARIVWDAAFEKMANED